jgi:hypothetical protein
MSYTYTPDRWVVVKLQINSDTIYKVLCTWYGSFTTGESWQINSGITSIEDRGNTWAFTSISGSVYVCPKQGQGFSAYGKATFDRMFSRVAEVEGVSVEVIEFNQIGILKYEILDCMCS